MAFEPEVYDEIRDIRSKWLKRRIAIYPLLILVRHSLN